ncbi:CPBP family intramembrane glutamic endopeptidase [Metabacillus malikii]|uniref:Membrane protease YdiL (CAAX protease family) n=1 Tax=Metabacillus malikii TaxID=1504265 RepID=A0ABT9ZEP9_9BACI|nr:CPBP family intramembrane glutamic endopeptidase [Metabacillus malikii]MDQ0230741.1 membrane protease YdiL (CAAX protease family) [Metabacillus malikii]
MEKEPTTKILVIFSSFIFGIIGFIILFFWKKSDMFLYLHQVFTFTSIGNDLLIGFIYSFMLSIVLVILLLLGKLYYPHTKGVIHLVDMLKDKPSNVLLVTCFPAVFEEFFFRAVLLGLLLTVTNPVIAILISSFVFVLAHLSDQYHGQYYLLTYLFLIGILTSVSFVIQETIWPAMIIHGLSNFMTSILTRKNIIPIKAN